MNHKRSSRFAVHLLSLFMVMLALVASASADWKEKVLYSFQNGTTDGQLPVGGVVFDKAGNLYGATAYGLGDCAPEGCGSVFQLTPPAKKGDPWTETVLHLFLGGSGDGAEPIGGLVIDGSGNLYGATWEGGTGNCDLGCGVVYEMKPPQTKGGDWTETVLYSFQGNNDGEAPNDDLMLDSDGNLYGATQYGGGYGSCYDQGFNFFYCGTIFKLSPPKSEGGNWTEKVLYSFKGGTDGATSHGNLAFGRDGAIYGTTLQGGGASKCVDGGGGAGCGTVFELRPPKKKGGAWSEKILHSFTGGNDGGWPGAGVVIDAKGSLYGGAEFGAKGAGGIVFRLATTNGGRWNETILHVFAGSGDDYYGPTVSLFDKSGNLYGTTLGGPGNSFIGSVFRLRPPGQEDGGHWTYNMLHGFTGAPDGKLPNPPLTFDKSGDLYGTTEYGGTGTTNCPGGGCGAVFEVKVSP
jgi:hypothetical protein